MQIFVRRSPKANWLLEFSFNNQKFYSIADKNVVRIPPYEIVRQKLNNIYSGATEAFDGCYCRETKTLALTAPEEA